MENKETRLHILRSYNNIPQALLNTAKKRGHLTFARIRIEGGFATYTYEQTLNNAKKIAAYLVMNGFAPGERAPVLGVNWP